MVFGLFECLKWDKFMDAVNEVILNLVSLDKKVVHILLDIKRYLYIGKKQWRKCGTCIV